MKKIVLVSVFASFASAAMAQQAPAPVPPVAQALYRKLSAEIDANIQCGTQLVTVQQELAAAQDEIKALKAKYEPPKKEPAK